MWITNGPTNTDTVVEFTNWNDVEKFAKAIVEFINLNKNDYDTLSEKCMNLSSKSFFVPVIFLFFLAINHSDLRQIL